MGTKGKNGREQGNKDPPWETLSYACVLSTCTYPPTSFLLLFSLPPSTYVPTFLPSFLFTYLSTRQPADLSRNRWIANILFLYLLVKLKPWNVQIHFVILIRWLLPYIYYRLQSTEINISSHKKVNKE